MKEVIVEQEQSIIDICLQEYGTLDALWEIHQLNGFTDYPALLQPGSVVLVDENSELRNRAMLKQMKGAAPGSYIWDTVPDNTYVDNSGTYYTDTNGNNYIYE